MPHLSPMNWLMAMTISWLFIILISSVNWWSQPNKFTYIQIKKASTNFKNWSWL